MTLGLDEDFKQKKSICLVFLQLVGTWNPNTSHMMRSLNFVHRISLDFTGTIFPHAICLGDADNDSVIRINGLHGFAL